MTPTHSRARQQAEIAFAEAQSQFRARERAVDELDAAAEARREKTLRLRAARLTRELEDRARAASTPQNPQQRSEIQVADKSDRIKS